MSTLAKQTTEDVPYSNRVDSVMYIMVYNVPNIDRILPMPLVFLAFTRQILARNIG